MSRRAARKGGPTNTGTGPVNLRRTDAHSGTVLKLRKRGIGEVRLILSRLEPQMKKTIKASTTIWAKRYAQSAPLDPSLRPRSRHAALGATEIQNSTASRASNDDLQQRRYGGKIKISRVRATDR